MNRPQSVDPVAIACIAMTLAVGVAAWLVTPRTSRVAAAESWIPLPLDGMDAGTAEFRYALAYAMDNDALVPHWRRALARTCGAGDGHDSAAETYVLTIGDQAYRWPYRTWRIEIRPQGALAQVTMQDATLMPHPPDGRAYEYVAPVVATTVALRDLEPLRTMWNSPAMWHEPQGNAQCIHKREARFEACVYGRYALRDRGCAPSAARADRVWRWVQARFPAPAPAHLEPAG